MQQALAVGGNVYAINQNFLRQIRADLDYDKQLHGSAFSIANNIHSNKEPAMIGYITIGVTDMDKGKAFWSQLLEPLGASLIMEMDRIAFLSRERGQAMLAVCIPYDKQAPKPGNGNMLAFPVDSREEVDKHHARALELGGTDEGAPGERMPTFYGGYFRDPDGNKAVFYKMG